MSAREGWDEGWDVVSGVGITALGVAATRAMETARDDALIDDPYAAKFVERAGERLPVPLPTSLGAAMALGNGAGEDADWRRFFVAMAGYMGVRTRFFDDWFDDATASGVRQVVILAAGLDTRAFRLSWPDGTTVFEIDQPRVLEFKDEALADEGAVARCARHTVPIDLREDWSDALLREGLAPDRPTAWLAEGLLPYLPAEAAGELFETVERLSAAGSRLAAEHMDPRARDVLREPRFAAMQRRHGVDMTAMWPEGERPDPAAWFRDHAWCVETSRGGDVARRYGRVLGDTAEGTFDTATLLTATNA
ncbi:MAG: class I SAM-dependent methyltransferase [Acidothermales bacterium]|nr:class I SAM-dependent methyltransferase [Acidothermales bacterium]